MPFVKGPSRRQRKLKILKRLLAISALSLLTAAVAGAAGHHFFTGWRARDLASKAKENFERGNYRMAWLQINSAKSLRAEEPDVLRMLGRFESAMGRPTALEHYEKLSRESRLTAEDLKTRAEMAARLGDDAQFAQAVEALAESGQVKDAGTLRAVRALLKGDLDRAVAEARTAAGASDDPSLKLALARALMQRYRPELHQETTPSAAALAASAEATAIVDALLSTPQRNDALAFALNEIGAAPRDRLRWANAAMEEIEAGNAALLPAAVALVRSRQKTPQQIHEQLRQVFDAAPLERRSAYALWLTGAGMPDEALTMLTAQEAAESTAAFRARTEALFATGNFDAILSAVEEAGSLDDDVRLAAKARAEYARGRGAQGGATALREAMVAAAKKGRLEMVIASGDAFGGTLVIDEKLSELCSDPSLTDYVFRVSRDRFSRSGRTSLLSTAYEHARAALPQSAAVEDYRRYSALIRGGKISLEETAAAAAAEPADVNVRITHALNLLKHGKSAEALEAFDTITVFAERLPPGQMAIIAAVLSANGDAVRARTAAASIKPDLLTPGEYSLIVALRAGTP